jgi:hypothetical protein
MCNIEQTTHLGTFYDYCDHEDPSCRHFCQPCAFAIERKALVHPRPLKEGNPMRGVVLPFSRLSSMLLVSLLVLSTHVLWAQRTSTLEEIAVQLPDAPSRVAMVAEAQTHLRPTFRGLLLSLKQNQGQAESWMRLFPDHTGYDRLSINTNAVLNQDAGTAKFWGKSKYFIGSAPPKWRTFAPTFGHFHQETIHGANDLEYYGHHIPWAGSVILRIGQQAKAHPHVTSVLSTVHPRF